MSYSRRQLYALGETLGECVTRKEGGRVVYGGGGSGGGGAPAETTQISDLPEWAKPYAKQTLGMGEALTTEKKYNPETKQYDIVGPAKYQTYPGQRMEPFDPLQQRAYYGVSQMQVPGQTGEASNIAQEASYRALNDQYQPGYFGNQFQAPEQYRTGRFDYMGVNAPELQQYQMGPAERVAGGQYDAPLMETAQTGYNPNLQQFQMGPAERAQAQSFLQPGTSEAYMSPFMQSVVDKQTREAERQAGIAARQQRSQSIQRGAFGGAGTAVKEAAAARDLAQLKSDIYGTGQQAAFQNAQQQFNAEQQARMQAQLANQQAGLTVGGQNLAAQLGIQQLGTQTGLQTSLANLNAQQQANVQNQAARLQAQGLTANQAMQAALANQQAGLTTGQQNLAAQLGIQQLGAGQNMQAQLANQQAYQNMLAQREASRQFGYGQRMTAAGQRAQYGQAAAQLGEQSRQFGAGYGQQGLATALSGAGQLGQLGQTQFGQERDIYGLQNQYGEQARALRQQDLAQQYQDFLNQQRHPYQQLEFMSGLLRGTPMGTVNTLYAQQPSMMSQLAGLGMGAYGLSKMVGSKKGGVVKSKKPAGLAELALAKMGA